MESSLRLGRIAGIEIGINWSWLIVFALITWSLAVGVFPSQNPGLANGTYIAMGLVAAGSFFASLLAHELGHAITARREGMELDGITLWLFGGVARFKGMFPSAAAELKIALAGPAVTLVVGLACALIAANIALPEAIDGVLAWLGYANLILLAFNLVPALPLDGGRVLRAVLWQVRKDFGWATTVAAAFGRGFGYFLIAVGVLMFIFQGAFTGAWLAFIGWFLLQAAGAEEHQIVARRALAGLRVADLMTSAPVTVPGGLTVGRFMDEVAWRRRHSTYPVLGVGGDVIGLLTFRCLASVPRARWDSQTIDSCMIPAERVPRFHPSTPALDAYTELAGGQVNRGVVLANGQLVGIISAADVARALELRPPRRDDAAGATRAA